VKEGDAIKSAEVKITCGCEAIEFEIQNPEILSEKAKPQIAVHGKGGEA